MELSIWDGISDMNEKTPPAEMANGVLHNNKSTCFYLLVLYPRRPCLLFKTERISVSIFLKMKSLCSMSLSSIASRTTSIVLVGSSNIWTKHWPKAKDKLHLDDMRNLNIKALTYEMLVELSGKKRKIDQIWRIGGNFSDNFQVYWDIIALIYSIFIPFPCIILRAGSRSFL